MRGRKLGKREGKKEEEERSEGEVREVRHS